MGFVLNLWKRNNFRRRWLKGKNEKIYNVCDVINECSIYWFFCSHCRSCSTILLVTSCRSRRFTRYIFFIMLKRSKVDSLNFKYLSFSLKSRNQHTLSTTFSMPLNSSLKKRNSHEWWRHWKLKSMMTSLEVKVNLTPHLSFLSMQSQRHQLLSRVAISHFHICFS